MLSKTKRPAADLSAREPDPFGDGIDTLNIERVRPAQVDRAIGSSGVTAKLQSRPTIKQIAIAAGVSERTLYMAIELIRTGREDLQMACLAGDMSLHAALKTAKPAKYSSEADRLAALRKAWLACSSDEAAAFLTEIGKAQ